MISKTKSPSDQEEMAMRTERTHDGAPGRLFPAITWDAGWSLSLQADKAGYACRPRARLDALEDYEAVEAVIHGPFAGPVDPAALGLPADLAAKFSRLEPGDAVSIGSLLDAGDIARLRAAIDAACLNPNAGVPEGCIGWAGRDVWHGTSLEAAEDILENGIQMGASSRGYFGEGFYVAEDQSHARASYAEASEDPGAVLGFTLEAGARILDLRNAGDADLWTKSGLARRIPEAGFAGLARRAGIDGVYDRSMGGLAIYNARVLGACRMTWRAAPEETPAP
jgi:hypothetical protein